MEINYIEMSGWQLDIMLICSVSSLIASIALLWYLSIIVRYNKYKLSDNGKVEEPTPKKRGRPKKTQITQTEIEHGIVTNEELEKSLAVKKEDRLVNAVHKFHLPTVRDVKANAKAFQKPQVPEEWMDELNLTDD